MIDFCELLLGRFSGQVFPGNAHPRLVGHVHNVPSRRDVGAVPSVQNQATLETIWSKQPPMAGRGLGIPLKERKNVGIDGLQLQIEL